MKTNPYRVFISGDDRQRFLDKLNTFEDINQRIISNHIGRLFNRVVVELTSEELAVVKLTFDRYECTIMEATDADKAGTLYDQLISASINYDS